MFLGFCVSEEYWKDKAVMERKAEYYLNEFNKKSWRWK